MTAGLSSLAQRLIQNGLLTETEVRNALDQARQAHVSLARHIINNRLLATKTIAAVFSAEFGVPYMDIESVDRHCFNASLIDPRLIRKYFVLPVFRRGNQLWLAIADPTDVTAINEVKFHTGLFVEPVLAEHDKLSAAIEKLANLHRPSINRLSADECVIDPETAPNTANDQNSEGEDLSLDEKPLVSFVNSIIRDAIDQGASDIHIEPYEHTCRLRFRIDGILHEVSKIPVNVAARVASRIKVLSRMDIAERRIPQDGRIKLSLGAARKIDVRVNTLPTLWGEKIVMRLLSSTAERLEIDTLGMEPVQLQQYRTALLQPQGMILVTGPTGCGKSMTLYTGLQLLNTGERNISTAENPVEMAIEGINQVQVNNKTGLGFATALRAFLRQDPDVVMVGEIRDLETAEIAVKASQTGHLVLSTLHTNSAAETLYRLIAMGIPAYNIATSVSLIVAQRLLRRLCPHCKEKTIIPENTLVQEGIEAATMEQSGFYRAVGCPHCTAGYRGRIGIYEVVPVNPSISHIIMSGGSALEIAGQIRKDGIHTLRQSALLKVSQGLTSLDEANRVT